MKNNIVFLFIALTITVGCAKPDAEWTVGPFAPVTNTEFIPLLKDDGYHGTALIRLINPVDYTTIRDINITMHTKINPDRDYYYPINNIAKAGNKIFFTLDNYPIKLHEYLGVIRLAQGNGGKVVTQTPQSLLCHRYATEDGKDVGINNKLYLSDPSTDAAGSPIIVINTSQESWLTDIYIPNGTANLFSAPNGKIYGNDGMFNPSDVRMFRIDPTTQNVTRTGYTMESDVYAAIEMDTNYLLYCVTPLYSNDYTTVLTINPTNLSNTGSFQILGREIGKTRIYDHYYIYWYWEYTNEIPGTVVYDLSTKTQIVHYPGEIARHIWKNKLFLSTGWGTSSASFSTSFTGRVIDLDTLTELTNGVSF